MRNAVICRITECVTSALGVKSAHDKTRAVLTNSHHLEESNLDGMSDQLVSVSNGQVLA